jgi:hypothetical protein
MAEKNEPAHNPEKIQRIYMEMRRGALLVPVRYQEATMPLTGPRFYVYRKYSEMGLEPSDPELAFWNALQDADTINGIGEFSLINANLTEPQVGDRRIQLDTIQAFVEPELRASILNQDIQGNALSVAFNRVGCLQTIRYLVLYGGANPNQDWNTFKIGRLALLGNEFLPDPSVPQSSMPSNLDLLLLVAPTWDIYNVRNIGHGMARIFTILTEIMPGSEPKVVKLLAQLWIVPDKIEIDGVPLNQFVTIVFGIFAIGRPPEGPRRVLFSSKEIFAQTKFPQPVLEQMLQVRARTIEDFRMLFNGGQEATRSTFAADLARRSFLTDGLNVFRKYPMLKLDSEKVLILDLQFVAELLTAGVYWSIFDGLPQKKRDTFKELWGHMFELYAVDLLAKFYPLMSGMFSPDVSYKDGQIDALLDFGSFVLVIEIKASLLTEPAKRSADIETFLKDFRRKFVENEKGNPKAIKQLASACRAILKGEVPMANRNESPVIYPIFISDEPTIETTFMNGFFNDEFQKEGIDDPKVKPLTIMAIDELEQLLSHVNDGDFTWEELLRSRFDRNSMLASSVGQTIYDMLAAKGLSSKQNWALKRKYDEVGEIMRACFEMPQRNSQSISVTE